MYGLLALITLPHLWWETRTTFIILSSICPNVVISSSPCCDWDGWESPADDGEAGGGGGTRNGGLNFFCLVVGGAESRDFFGGMMMVVIVFFWDETRR